MLQKSKDAQQVLPDKSASSILIFGIGQDSAFFAVLTGQKSIVSLWGVADEFMATNVSLFAMQQQDWVWIYQSEVVVWYKFWEMHAVPKGIFLLQLSSGYSRALVLISEGLVLAGPPRSKRILNIAFERWSSVFSLFVPFAERS